MFPCKTISTSFKIVYIKGNYSWYTCSLNLCSYLHVHIITQCIMYNLIMTLPVRGTTALEGVLNVFKLMSARKEKYTEKSYWKIMATSFLCNGVIAKASFMLFLQYNMYKSIKEMKLLTYITHGPVKTILVPYSSFFENNNFLQMTHIRKFVELLFTILPSCTILNWFSRFICKSLKIHKIHKKTATR